jgi:hypothetical protein
MERRLSEAARRGFTRAIIPRGAGGGAAGLLRTIEVRDLAEAIASEFPRHIESGVA